MANKIEQSFYSVYSYSGTDSIERALSVIKLLLGPHGRRLCLQLNEFFFQSTAESVYDYSLCLVLFISDLLVTVTTNNYYYYCNR